MKGFWRVVLAAGLAFGLPQPPLPTAGTGFIGTYQCAQDNCLRAVLATNVNPREQARRKRECSALLKTTVLGTPTSVVTQTCRATTYTETVQVTVYQPTATSVRLEDATTARSNSSQIVWHNTLSALEMATLTKPTPALTTNVQYKRDADAYCSRCLEENQRARSSGHLDKRQLLPGCTFCSTQSTFIVTQTSTQTITQSAPGPSVTVIPPSSTAQSTGIPSVTITTTFTTTQSDLTETHTSTVVPPSPDVPIPAPSIPAPLPTAPIPTPSAPNQVPTIVPVPTEPIPIPTLPTPVPPSIPAPTIPGPSDSPTTPIPSSPTVTRTVTATQTSSTQTPPVPTITPPVPTITPPAPTPQPPPPPPTNTPTPQPTPPPTDEGNEFALLAIPGYATGLCAKPEDYVSACECYGVRPQVSTRPPVQAVSTHWVYNTVTTTATVTMPGTPCRRKREVCAPFATEAVASLK
ncbi:hypothetical protein PpBr36_05568 [Pyricularia pennisetigena]|uniref:hypothetical protein n=1 Tax=Pyricularia pennisetigena TaxID=1578925 RepID=UPI001154D58F|nr:hypothetical protein PpBr36_05568 [Pyricularia pennisetigena]TLS27188.1 hypothetical protein PpBr36_05568 [Pyricularia pennisetigena]